MIQIGIEETSTDGYCSLIETEQISSVIQNQMPNVTAHMMSSIVYPTQGKVRTAKLKEIFDAVSKLAENCEARYKYFFAILTEEE